MKKIKELLKNKKVLMIIGAILVIVIIIICVSSCGKSKLEDNHNSNGSDNNSKNKIVDKNGNYIIPKDYNPTDEKCFEFENGTITKYYCKESNIYNYETITDIVIPYKIDGQWVTTIESNAFDYANISNLVMPNSIKEIKKSAFSSDLNSAKITFSETLETIEEYAFENNQDYENEEKCVDVLEIPKSVKYIGNKAFAGSCYKEVIISTSIGDYAFQNSKIEKLTLKDGVKTIGKNAFEYNKIKHLEFPNTLETISDWGFANNNIIDIKLNSGLNSIGYSAFRGYTEEKRYEIDFTDIPLTRIYLADKSQRSFEWDSITAYNDTVEYILPGEKAKDFSICILETEKNEASIYEKIIIYKDGDNILDVKEYGISKFYDTGCNQLGWSCNFPAKEAAEEFEKKQTEAGYVVDRSYEEVSFEKKYEVKDLDDKSVTSYIKKLEAKGYNCQ